MGCLQGYCLAKPISFHVKVILLDKQELIQEIESSTTGQSLLDGIFKYLNLIETAYFGLRYQDNSNQTHWLDQSRRIISQLNGLSPIIFYLGVKFYSADPCRLVEEITRYHFFLQLKSDVLHGRLPVSNETAVHLAALALQSELGDYDPNIHSPGYASEFRFVPSQTEEMESAIEAVHQRLIGVKLAKAESAYLERVKWMDMYGVDLHQVNGEDNIEYFLGLTPLGIIVLRNRIKIGNYFWPRIGKIYFKGKHFMLRVRDKNNEDSIFGFETPNKKACKHLWKCCVEHHAFFRLVQVSPRHITPELFSLGSRFRYSGRTEKESVHDVSIMQRKPPQFTRMPSKRYARRGNTKNTLNNDNDNDDDDGAINETTQKNVILDKTVASTGNLINETLTSPWYSNLKTDTNLVNGRVSKSLAVDAHETSVVSTQENLQNLSLQSLQWIETGDKSRLRSSLSRNSSYSQQHQRSSNSRGQRHSSSGASPVRASIHGESDEESEAAGGATLRRRRCSGDSVSNGSTIRSHRSHRRRRHGSYRLVEPEEQSKGGSRNPQRMSRCSSTTHIDVNGADALAARSNDAVFVAPRNSGYVNSGAETESEIVSSIRRNRRRVRSRSRSPGEHHSRSRLPKELVRHFEFGLVEPSAANMRGDIPYKCVETAKPIRLRQVQYNVQLPEHENVMLNTYEKSSVTATDEREYHHSSTSVPTFSGPVPAELFHHDKNVYTDFERLSMSGSSSFHTNMRHQSVTNYPDLRLNPSMYHQYIQKDGVVEQSVPIDRHNNLHHISPSNSVPTLNGVVNRSEPLHRLDDMKQVQRSFQDGYSKHQLQQNGGSRLLVSNLMERNHVQPTQYTRQDSFAHLSVEPYQNTTLRQHHTVSDNYITKFQEFEDLSRQKNFQTTKQVLPSSSYTSTYDNNLTHQSSKSTFNLEHKLGPSTATAVSMNQQYAYRGLPSTALNGNQGTTWAPPDYDRQMGTEYSGPKNYLIPASNQGHFSSDMDESRTEL